MCQNVGRIHRKRTGSHIFPRCALQIGYWSWVALTTRTMLQTVFWEYMIVTTRYVSFRPDGTISRERQWRSHLTVLLQDLLIGDTREANNYRAHNREDNSVMEFPAVCAELNSHIKMTHALCEYAERFKPRSRRYIQMRQTRGKPRRIYISDSAK